MGGQCRSEDKSPHVFCCNVATSLLHTRTSTGKQVQEVRIILACFLGALVNSSTANVSRVCLHVCMCVPAHKGSKPEIPYAYESHHLQFAIVHDKVDENALS
eukprot:1160700-Pelagomonas_calceolata.AAC.1